MTTLQHIRSLFRPRKVVFSIPQKVSRRHFSRATLMTGFLVFVVATVGLAATVELLLPEWRDPDYGYRLKQLRKWQAESPDRPFVLLIGTSRVQMGISPVAMGFADEPGSPLVFNSGYRGGTPLWCCLQATRILDSDVKVRALIFSFSYAELLGEPSADKLYQKWASRVSAGDLQRLAPYCEKTSTLTRAWAVARLQPWTQQRELIGCEQCPDWFTGQALKAHSFATSWRDMDSHGYSPWPTPIDTNLRATFLANNQTLTQPGLTGKYSVSECSNRSIHDLVRRCQREGIAVAGLCSPESPTYQSWYTDAGRAAYEKYMLSLRDDLGITIFPAPAHLTDEDFADGYHLIASGAAKYSKWLAEKHLKPWFDALK